MLRHLRPALSMLVFFTLLLGLAYPLAFVALGRVAMTAQAGGSPLMKGSAIVGSALVGQNFREARYFQGRPSATSAPDPADSTKTVDAPYNAGNSSGSNLGPLSQKLIDRVTAAAGNHRNLPADSVTTSASGLDPHVTPANALLQVARIAAARNLPEQRVRSLVEARTEWPLLGFIGEPRVNILQLNIALDAL